MASATTALIPFLKGIFRLLPKQAPEVLYTTLLRPKPLRRAVNRLILKMIPATVTVQGVTIALNTKDPVVSGALALGVYEGAETRFLREKIKPGMRVLDIGANVGYYTALFSQWVGPEGRVLAFEPEPGNFGFLSKTIAANGFPQARAMNVAVGQETGETLLFLSDSNQGDHRIYRSDDKTQGETEKTLRVPIVSIDRLLPADEPVDFIKMDVQGAEGLVLSGMRETLRRNPGVMMLTEFWPDGLLNAGVDPLAFLQTLHDDLEMTLWEVSGEENALAKIDDLADLIRRCAGRKYANLFCARPESAPSARWSAGSGERKAAA